MKSPSKKNKSKAKKVINISETPTAPTTKKRKDKEVE
jgi:hypothetical protein